MTSVIVCFSFLDFVFFDFISPDYNRKRLYQFVFFLFIIFFVFKLFFEKGFCFFLDQFSSLSLLLVGILLVLCTISSFNSLYFLKSIQEIGLYCLIFLSCLYLRSEEIRENELIFSISLIGGSVVVYFFTYLFDYVIYLKFPPEAWSNTIHNFSNPREMNHAQNWLIPFLALLPLISNRKYKLLGRLSWLPIIFMYFFLIMSEGRGVSIAIILSIAFTCYLFPKFSKVLAFTHLKSFGFGLFLYILLVQIVPSVFGITSNFDFERFVVANSTSSGRVELWKIALDSIQDNPFFGIGPQHFITLVGSPGSPHNIILQWASEWGVPAAICLIILIIWGGMSYLRGLIYRVDTGLLSSHQQLLQISAFTALLSAGIHSQVSGVFISPMSQMLMILVLGFCMGVHSKDLISRETVSKWFVIILLLLFSSAYFAILYWEYFAGNYPTTLEFQPNAPRFWRNGAFHNE
ncbi:O-antigen ligase family protein [Endozoicomonas sp. ALD040]|uniref:O-antigen ligase family protein n=1 Tax=unclassified Endozoicomonas TaxID=2644528 RepID=UPI003BAF9CE6